MSDAAAAGWMLLVAFLVGCDRGSSPSTSASPSTSTPAIVARLTDDPEQTRGPPGVLLLGSVRGGDSIRRTLYLQNTAAVAQTIDRWTSSCECLELGEAPLVVAPHGHREVSLSIDGGSLSDFRGALAIEVAGYDGDERIVSFQVRLDVEGDASGRAAEVLDPIPADDSERR